jgi:flagellar biosynthesis GTPase FlhF
MSAMAERRAFRGETLEDALRLVRDELGPDAIVVRQREGVVGGVGGFFGRRCVELEVETPAHPSGRSPEPLDGADLWAEDSWAEPMPTGDMPTRLKPATPRAIPPRAVIDLYDSGEAPSTAIPVAAEAPHPVIDTPEAAFTTPLDRYLSAADEPELATMEMDALHEPEPESPLVRTLYEQASPFADELAQAFERTELETLPVMSSDTAVALAPIAEPEQVAEPDLLPALAEPIRVLAEQRPAPAPVFDPTGMCRRLVIAGLDERLARDVVAEAESELRLFDPTEPFDRQVRSALARRIRVARSSRRKGRRVVALVGPSGSGKTLTAARLCHAYGTSGRSVAALSLQHLREAFELAQQTQGLDVELAVAADSTTLQLELQRLAPADLLVVDTPAIDPHDEDRLGLLTLLLDLVGADETHLLMPTSLGTDDARMLLDTVAPALGVDRLVFTHRDGPGRACVGVSAAIRSKLPVSFTATGGAWGLRPADAYALAGDIVG